MLNQLLYIETNSSKPWSKGTISDSKFMVSEAGKVGNMKRYGEVINEHGIVREKFCCPTEFHDFNINYKFQ